MPLLAERPRSIEKESFFVTCAYLALSGAAMLVNSLTLKEPEVPWTWVWVIWMIAFSPPIIAAVFAAATVDWAGRRLTAMYATSVVLTIVSLEALLIAEAGSYAVVMAVGVLCCATWFLFRLVSPRESGGPTTLKSD